MINPQREWFNINKEFKVIESSKDNFSNPFNDVKPINDHIISYNHNTIINKIDNMSDNYADITQEPPSEPPEETPEEGS